MAIRHLTINELYTEAEILALTGQVPGDMFRPTDNNTVIYKADASGVPALDTETEVVYVTNDTSSEFESVPESTVSETLGVHSIDSSASTFLGLATGASSGVHEYSFNGFKNTVDLSAVGTPITIVAGTNVTITGNNVIKNIDGNTWNSSFSSAESFDPLIQDFAFTWEIEDVTGTIREMAGLDDNPAQNNSYSSIEYAVYQVNNYFYSRVYEKGAALAIPNYTTFYFQAGDRCGVRVVDGIATYYVDRAGTITDIHTSTAPTAVPMYFKAAFNRGNTSSGASSLGNVLYHDATVPSTVNYTIRGPSADPITQEHKDELSRVLGMQVQAGATYGNVQFSRLTTSKFMNGPTPYDITMKHAYFGMYGQDIKTLTF